MKKISIALGENSRAEFHNNTAYCVGTGRMGLALHKEYLDQLEMAQNLAGFAHIRGHGLFSDDMAIYQPYTDAQGVTHEAYNFTYLDRVMDSYLRLGLRPFLELGFMPKKMASGTQTIFYWEGNVTPPSDMAKWTAMVRATLAHLRDRYGYEEVCRWPCEVWNEPNLKNFWENADKEKYLELYAATAKAVWRMQMCCVKPCCLCLHRRARSLAPVCWSRPARRMNTSTLSALLATVPAVKWAMLWQKPPVMPVRK